MPVADFTFDVSPDDYTLTWTVLDADGNAVSQAKSKVSMLSRAAAWTWFAFRQLDVDQHIVVN